ncbi:MAG: DUF45 domain-containing protein [Bacteroidia bacterium]|nr:DUF45 domain-containing protein [Bacteroidia bacterium]
MCRGNDYTNNMVYELAYERNGKRHPVVVSVKRIKHIIFRYKEGSFLVSTPKNTPDKIVFDYLDRFYERLLAKDAKRTTPYIDGKMYLLGELLTMSRIESRKTPFVQEGQVFFVDEVDMKKKLRKFAKEYYEGRVRLYEKIMGIKVPYQIKVRDMKTRFGTNSRKTHALSFQLRLIHFSPKIIDAIVIHELAHDRHFDHGRKFYDELYKYCPDYKMLVTKLKRGEYA